MAMTYPEWANLCLTDVRKWVNESDADFESMIPKLYTMGTADGQEEYDMTYSGMGKFKKLSGTANKDTMTEEYKTTYDFPEFMNELDIQRRLWNDKKDRTVMNMAQEFSLSKNRTKEAHAGDMFNYAFTTTGTSDLRTSTAHADAKALCASDHPSKANSGYSGSNLGTSAFGTSALMTTRDAMRDWTDGRGNKIHAKLDTILGGANKTFEETAWEIINTTGKVDVADNNRNFHQGRYALMIWDELTDAENWFGIDSKRKKFSLHWLDRIPYENYDTFNNSTQMLTYGGYMRYGANANNWRFIYGHNVA